MGTPNPPPTTSGASTTSDKQCCPQKAHKPCDVDKLTLEASGVKTDSEAGVTRKLETTKVRRRERVRDVKAADALRLLGTYDLMIDVIADPDSPTIVGEKGAIPARVWGKGNYHGRSCPSQAHASITLKPLGLAPELKGKTAIIKKQPGATELSLPPTKLFATRSFIDDSPDKAKDSPFDEVTNVFGIFKALWDAFDAKMIEVRADGCGIRAKEDRKAANKALYGLVRIYRKSKWSVGVKIPPLGSFKGEKAASVDVRGLKNTSSSREVSGGFNYYKDERKSEASGDGALGTYKHTGQTQRGGDVSAYEQSRDVRDGSVSQTFKEQYSRQTGREMVNTDGHITSKDINDRLARAHGFEIVIAHNGTEVAILDALNRIKDMVNKIVNAIKDVQTLLKKVPQVGWKITLEVSAFSGKILMEWWPEYLDRQLAGGRYYPVEWKLKGSIQMEIVNAAFTVSFGVDARALDSGLVIKVAGTIELKASIAKDIDMDFFMPKQVFDVGAEANAKLEVVGYVSVLGKTLADAVLTASTGLELKGKLHLEWATRTCDLKGELKTKPIMLSGYIRVPWWFDDHIDPPIKLLEGTTLYKFT